MKSSNLIQNVHLDAVYDAFLIVYAMWERLEKAMLTIENPGPGRNAGVITHTSAAKITLPAYARPSAQVRLAKNQILNTRRIWADRKTNKAINQLIANSFENINARNKSGFRKAFARFKLESQKVIPNHSIITVLSHMEYAT